MFKIRLQILLTILLVPILAFTSNQLEPESITVSYLALAFAAVTSVLTAISTTETRLYFARKLVFSFLFAYVYFMGLTILFYTWIDEQRDREAEVWGPMPAEVVTAQFRILSTVIAILAALGLFWLVSSSEVKDPE